MYELPKSAGSGEGGLTSGEKRKLKLEEEEGEEETKPPRVKMARVGAGALALSGGLLKDVVNSL